jgi:hypothetical protein
MDASTGGSRVSPARAALQWRALVAAALLSLALGVVLSRVLRFEHSSLPPAAHSAASRPNGLSSLPLAAQGEISGVLGADSAAYRLRTSAGGFQALSPAQRLQARFDSTGVSLSSGAIHVGLSLRAAGYGPSLTVLGDVTPSASSNRVSYVHAGLSEWYVNGPLGLEQGFTVPRAPADDVSDPLTLSMELSGNAHASLATGGQSITLSRAGSPSLRYGGLSASDATGRALPSRLVLHGEQLLLRVDPRGARYPLRIDPIIQQEPEQKLTPRDESGEGDFGYSVALSADGNTALIGGPRDGSQQAGAVWVFVRSGSTWTQQGPKLLGGEQSGEASVEHCGEEPGNEPGEEEGEACRFGRRVALSADGNTALIGNPRASGLEGTKKEEEAEGQEEAKGEWVPNVGAAWVFTRSGTTWTEQGVKLTGGEERGKGRFGRSVALSADGETALIGGTLDGDGRGSAWVFTRSGSTWTQQGPKLTGGEEVGQGYFGVSVALSGDGETALIGGPVDAKYRGAVWAFTRSGSTWTQQGPKLTGGEEVGEGHFGYSVALSSDGSTALVGARGDNGSQGAAFAFTRSGSSWNEEGPKLTDGDEGGGEFGYSVALSSDGSTALVGGPLADAATGGAWLFERSGTSWSAPGMKLDASAARGRGRFGSSVALSSDGSTALVGAPSERVAEAGKPGGVWAFGEEPHPLLTGLIPKKGPTAGGTSVKIEGANLNEVTAVKFGTANAQKFEVTSRESIVAESPPGEVGEVDVTVTNPHGTSVTGAEDRFTYAPPKKGASRETGTTTSPSPPKKGASRETGTTTSLSPLVTSAGGVLAFKATTSAACTPALRSKKIMVQGHRRALVKLVWKGAGKCGGTVRLLVSRKVGKRVKTKTIATGVFAIGAGETQVVKMKFNAAGLLLLWTHDWRLSAKLTILGLSPRRGAAKSAKVSLAQPKPPVPRRG